MNIFSSIKNYTITALVAIVAFLSILLKVNSSKAEKQIKDMADIDIKDFEDGELPYKVEAENQIKDINNEDADNSVVDVVL